MAKRFSAEIRTTWAQTRAFDYLVDFRNLPDWHPAVVEASLISPDPQMRNARYEVRASFAGQRIKAEIQVVELERPILIVATAENAGAFTEDRFALSDDGSDGVAITYRSELRLKAPLRVIGPLMVPALTSAWGNAAAGLEQLIGESAGTGETADVHGRG